MFTEFLEDFKQSMLSKLQRKNEQMKGEMKDMAKLMKDLAGINDKIDQENKRLSSELEEDRKMKAFLTKELELVSSQKGDIETN
jgi:predicted RNase H-like nuclease (RuvC/YqgF family)